MRRLVDIAFSVALLLGWIAHAQAFEPVFASASDARQMLATADDFVKRLSPFDRAARLKTDREVSESEYLAFVASSALDWTSAETNLVETALHKILPEINRLSLPLPEKIHLIKTSGTEEGDAAYTRGNAIMLPRHMLASTGQEMQKLLAHELFHIASRNHPELARRLYAAIGFRYCGEVGFPPELAPRKITNPDAPKNDYCIALKLGVENILAIPILFSRVAHYDTTRGGEFFDYLQLALLLVEHPDDSVPPRVLVDAQGPRLAKLQQVSGFFEQVGRNTEYIIHPEEILADNFALLVVGEPNVKSPELLSRLHGILATAGKAGPVISGDAADSQP